LFHQNRLPITTYNEQQNQQVYNKTNVIYYIQNAINLVCPELILVWTAVGSLSEYTYYRWFLRPSLRKLQYFETTGQLAETHPGIMSLSSFTVLRAALDSQFGEPVAAPVVKYSRRDGGRIHDATIQHKISKGV